MGWVNREGRQDGEKIAEEPRLQRRHFGLGHRTGLHQTEPLIFQLAAEFSPARLLVGHKVRRLGVDPDQLLGRRQAVLAHHPHAFADLGLQAGDADHVEFVEVVGADRQEPQPLQQRMARVHALGQHTTVESQPRELAIDEPGGRAGEA